MPHHSLQSAVPKRALSRRICFALGISSFLALFPAGLEASFLFKEEPGKHLDILHDGKLVARYHMEHDVSTEEKRHDTYKPFLAVYDAEGNTPLTKGPGGQFTHHRGIFLGWNKLEVGGKSYDLWHMTRGDQIHKQFSQKELTECTASFTSEILWQKNKDSEEPALVESRTYTLSFPEKTGRLQIDVESKLTAVAGDTVLGGDPEHAGLQFRSHADADPSKTAYLYPKADADALKDRDYPWVGQTFALNGKQHSVIYLNHPSNPKDTAFSAYRDYGRFGAFFKTSIPNGETLNLKVRFLVLEGELPSPEDIQKASNHFTGKEAPTPATTFKKVGKPKQAWVKPLTSEVQGSEIRFTQSTVPPVSQEGGVPLGPKPPGRSANHNAGPKNFEIKFKVPTPKPLSPQEAIKAMKVEEGFEVQIVAAEPLIEAPVAMCFDPQGRLYVVEMRGYMLDVNGRGEDEYIGRVSLLEDTDGDGRMDKATPFADKLLMPRSVMPYRKGVLISEPPNLTYYEDTDGDGIADHHEVLVTDYAKAGGQPEHLANHPTWTLDNWIHSANHATSYVSQNGKLVPSKQPTSTGQWGLSQDDWGRIFFNYNSDLLRANLVPGAFYQRNPNLATRTALNYQVMRQQSTWPIHPTPGVNRGYEERTLRDDGTLQNATGTGGAVIYRGNLFPEAYRGNAFIPEPCGNLVKRVVLSEDWNKNLPLEAQNAYQNKEFLASTDERFRPVTAMNGPDGALYVVDLARGIVQHKAFLTDYLIANIEERDLTQPLSVGRIFRVVPKGSKPKPAIIPENVSDDQLATFLAHENGHLRDTAQRLLVEKGEKLSVKGLEMLKKIALEAKMPQARVHALYTLQGLNQLTPDILTQTLNDAHPKVRVASIRLTPTSLRPMILTLVNDPDTEVRLNIAYHLGTLPLMATEGPLKQLVEKGAGPLLAEALASSGRGMELEWIASLLKNPPASDAKYFAPVLRILAECVSKENRPSRVEELVKLIQKLPTASPTQIALLEGLAGTNDKNLPKPAVIQSEPAILKLDAGNHAALKTLIHRLDTRLLWAGKPGVELPKPPTPLTAEEQAWYQKGQNLYASICAACHQQNGAGLDGLAPPLVDSNWVTGNWKHAALVVLHGLSGQIDVNGTTWKLDMPPVPLSDEDISAVLTYIRRDWDHTGSAVSPKQVQDLRKEFQSRNTPWTEADIKKVK